MTKKQNCYSVIKKSVPVQDASPIIIGIAERLCYS